VEWLEEAASTRAAEIKQDENLNIPSTFCDVVVVTSHIHKGEVKSYSAVVFKGNPKLINQFRQGS